MDDKTIFERIGFIVSELMELAFGWLHISGFPEAISTLLLTMMVIFIARCWWSIHPMWKRIDAARSNLKRIETLPDGIADLQNFESAITSKNDFLKENWLQFRKTLARRGRQDCMTTLPSVFISLGKLGLEAPLRRLGKWSGLFVGIGLCVTFLGLVAALSAATGAINAATSGGGNSTEAMQQALKDLLHAASFKFYTSIFGLFASLVVSYVEKLFRRKFDEKIGLLCYEIERLLPVVTSEQLLADQVEEAKQTTAQLKQFNSEMSEGLVSLSGAMDTALRENITPIPQQLGQRFQETVDELTKSLGGALQKNIEPLRDGIDRVGQNLGVMERTIGENIGEMQERTLATLAEKLGSVVNDQAGNELNGLAQTLEQLTISLSGVASSLEQGGGSFAETLESAVRELQAGIAGLTDATENISKSVNEDMGKAQQALQERMALLTDELSSRGQAAAVHLTEATSTVLGTMQGSVAGVGEQVQHLTVSLEQASHALSSHRQAISDAALQTRDAAQTIVQASQSLGGATSPMQASVKSMDDSMKKLLEGASTLSGSVRQAEVAIKTASESLERIWEQHVSRFQNVDENLAQILRRIMQDLDSNSTKMSDYINNIDDQLGKAVGLFGENIQELNDVFEEYLPRLQNANRQ